MDIKNDESDQSAIRLNRYLAQCGLGSRRSVERLITGGRIYLNGKKVINLGTVVNPDVDRLEYKGQELSAIRKLEYFAYHKPASIIVTKSDPEGRETVFDAIKKDLNLDIAHLNYVGRLDVNSEGLLLFTNDGNLIHALTHPRYQIKKVYAVLIDKELSREAVDRMTGEGVESEGQVLHAGRIEAKGGDIRNGFWYEVTLFEGKNRQVRRMMEAFSYKILRLRRIHFGSVSLGDLPVNKIRPLTEKEIAALQSAGYPVKSNHG